MSEGAANRMASRAALAAGAWLILAMLVAAGSWPIAWWLGVPWERVVVAWGALFTARKAWEIAGVYVEGER